VAHFSRIAGTDGATDGIWLTKLDAAGAPIGEFTVIPVEALPGVDPVPTAGSSGPSTTHFTPRAESGMTVPASPPVTASLFAIFTTFANFTP
jgi:hypothetical protein